MKKILASYFNIFLTGTITLWRKEPNTMSLKSGIFTPSVAIRNRPNLDRGTWTCLDLRGFAWGMAWSIQCCCEEQEAGQPESGRWQLTPWGLSEPEADCPGLFLWLTEQ